MQDLIREYREAENLLSDPSKLLDTANVDRVGLTRTAYVSHIPDSDGANDADLQPNIDGSTIRLNVHQSIDLNDEDLAESFYDLLNALNITTLTELLDAEYPRTRKG
ncbi:hypothetical protein D8S78_12485 [Natrialba swarupiae]|nr:hypothetical protein [Natrialba swarupiae]